MLKTNHFDLHHSFISYIIQENSTATVYLQ